ncbi:MAG: undecaprenyldiphospho-muramoylpentapeptide beta-N-acetylglucosaminyltransferase [Gammaproteobacteria bacterium]|nr:undecaprenyldiphospho-muramoylpentapeptide beta-N-acetylglucosaminyltransferase [Gammaproteobacteria bacterium]MDP2140179.1 undecaprenyldiphospho-muramoylpentapeptide beta-N-acetylglucosaminyltransferase [Gammaproteobacteria bacterium]MDP2348055.1 undecaprenyldiphospho-muramoylpentapeptide beta-N-acetylglucosaminyltransferase [Gammaproteobacteria bacterium]
MSGHTQLAVGNAGTVLIMAGGTGGHIFPALSIARNLQSRGYRTEWLGTERGMEVEVLRDTDIPLHFIRVRGLRGKGILGLLLAPFMILGAVMQSLQVLRAVKPCCVLGMGGYVTGPGGVAAKLSGKKLLIHEQNAIAGFSNRLLARIADRVMEAFPGTFRASPGVVFTGNPVRAEIVALAEPQLRVRDASNSLRVLVLGGSLGAVAINRLIPAALQELSEHDRPEIWHQSGRNNLNETRKAYTDAGIELHDKCRVDSFIADMAAAYSWADLVICRAGALTVSEIAAVGVPSVLIPFPHAVDDHQTRNAQWLSQAGAALLIQQADLSAQGMALRFKEFRDNREKLAAMAAAARTLARPDACDLVTRECMEACKG